MAIPTDIDGWFTEQDDASGHEIEDAEGLWWNSRFEMFWCSVLKMCGCGTDEPKRVMARLLWALYSSHVERAEKRAAWMADNTRDFGRSPYDFCDKAWWNQPIVGFALHVLHSRGLLEHGSSIDGSWLNEAGAKAVGEMFGEVKS